MSRSGAISLGRLSNTEMIAWSRSLSTIAHTSDSAFMRREAIFALRDIGNRQSLLVLASLLDVNFPR